MFVHIALQRLRNTIFWGMLERKTATIFPNNSPKYHVSARKTGAEFSRRPEFGTSPPFTPPSSSPKLIFPGCGPSISFKLWIYVHYKVTACIMRELDCSKERILNRKQFSSVFRRGKFLLIVSVAADQKGFSASFPGFSRNIEREK